MCKLANATRYPNNTLVYSTWSSLCSPSFGLTPIFHSLSLSLILQANGLIGIDNNIKRERERKTE